MKALQTNQIQKSVAYSDRGTSMLEFAFIAPIVFLFIFLFIEVARYWQTSAAISEAASETLSQLVVHPDMKRNNPANTTDMGKYTAAKAAFEATLRQKINNLVAIKTGEENSGATFVITVPDSDHYKNQPVEIAITAAYQSLAFPVHPRIEKRIAGYIEPLRTYTEPVPTDCHGTLYDSSDPPGKGYQINTVDGSKVPYGQLCPCQGAGYRVANGDCACNGDRDAQGNPYYINYLDRGNAIHKQPNGQCGCNDPNQVPVAGMDWANWRGIMNTPEEIQGRNNANSICCPIGTPYTCPVGQRRAYSCDCYCSDTTHASLDANGACKCNNPNKVYLAGINMMAKSEGACYCANGFDQNGSKDAFCAATGLKPDYEKCTCVCPDGNAPDANGQCANCGSSRHWDAGQNMCVCNVQPNQCLPGTWHDSAECKCKCNASGLPADPDGGCSSVCIPGLTHWDASRGGCACDDPGNNPPPGQHFNSSMCRYECDNVCNNGFEATPSNSCSCSTGCQRHEWHDTEGNPYCSDNVACTAGCSFKAPMGCECVQE